MDQPGDILFMSEREMQRIGIACNGFVGFCDRQQLNGFAALEHPCAHKHRMVAFLLHLHVVPVAEAVQATSVIIIREIHI